ncbi:EF-hand domain-containing protein [Halomonas piscis]|uniref:EF-hand domain-containing protein n=1 Tax=Halomonas piscis TaxID=3031727 RepID=UPI00289D425D|nr:EF-hand domain-containing protein [Halomonas piscis]
MARQYKTGLIITGDASGGIRAIKATEDQLGKLNRGFDRGTQRSRQFQQSVNNAGREMQAFRRSALAVTTVFAAAASGMYLFTKSSMDAVDAQAKLARKLDTTIGGLRGIELAASDSGVAQGRLESALQSYNKRLGDTINGTGEAQKAYKKLGLEASELAKIPLPDQLAKIAERISMLDTAAERSSIADRLMSGGRDVVALFESGGDAIRDAIKEVDDYGLAISQVDAAGVEAANDALSRTTLVTEAARSAIATELAPVLLVLAEDFNTAAREAGGWGDVVLQSMSRAVQAIGPVLDGLHFLSNEFNEVELLSRKAGAVIRQSMLELAATIAEGPVEVVNDLANQLSRIPGIDIEALAQPEWTRNLRASAQAAAVDVSNLSAQLMSLRDGAKPSEKLEAFFERVSERSDQLRASVETTGESFRTLDQWMFNSGGTAETSEEFEKLKLSLDTVYKAQQDYAATVKTLDDELRQGSITQAEYTRLKGLAKERLDAATGATKRAAASTKAAAKADKEAAKAAEQRAQALESLRRELDPAYDAGQKLAESTETLSAGLLTGGVVLSDYLDLWDKAADVYGEATTGTDDQAKSLESLASKYDQHHQKAAQLEADLKAINKQYKAGDIGGQKYQRMVGNVREEMRQVSLEADPMAQELASAWEEAGKRIDETFADAFTGAFDSFDDFADQLLDGFKRLLGELAYQATLKPIVVSVTGQMQGMFGGGGQQAMLGQGGGFGGPGGIISAGKNLWNSAQQGFGNIAWTGASNTAYTGGWAGSATSGIGQSGLWGGSTANFGGMTGLASGGTGMAGNWAGSQMFGEGEYSSTLGTIGGGIGTYFGGPVGAFIGSTAGSALGGLLGGGEWEQTGSGLGLSVSDGRVGGSSYVSEKKDGGWFGSSGSRKRATPLSGGMMGELQAVYDATEASLEATLEVLGYQSDALDGYTTALTSIDTKGLSDAEAKQAVEDWFQGVLDGLVRHGAGDVSAYRMEGESAADAVNRLAGSLSQLNPLLAEMELAALDASLAGGEAASNILEMSGGIDALRGSAARYYEVAYTEQERQTRAILQAQEAITRFNAATGSAVSDAGGLRDLVDSLDLMTEHGQRTYAMAMQVAGAFDELEEGIEASVQRITSQFDELLSSAEAAISGAESQLRRAWETFDKQSFGQRITLLEMLGDSEQVLALQRERELLSIDPLLHETQRHIWALQDEAAAQQDAAKAAQDYQRELASIESQLAQSLGSISQWIDTQQATGQSPGNNLTAAGDQFARQLAQAESGDRAALQSITQYADQYLAAGRDMFASGSGFQRIEQDVLDALESLPDAISAEEFLAQEVRQALQDATADIGAELGGILRSDNPSQIAGALSGHFATLAGGIDGVLTREQLAVVMAGKATDAQLDALMRAVDLNGDGVMSGLESVIIESLPTDAVLANVLKAQLKANGDKALTSAQVKSALSPIASDAEIARLIRRVDANGDGIISAEELTASQVGGLSDGIGSALLPMFDSLDSSLDGLIDYGEFSAAFAGMATDEQLRDIFALLDKDGSGTISQLEALNESGQGTESNTQSLEERAHEQLGKLTGLVAEMSRTTDQFVGLNSGINGLADAVNALGVAQEEAARIERERLAAEKAERERLEAERKEAARQARIEQHIANLSSAISKRDAANAEIESGTAKFADKLSDSQLNSINRFLTNRVGSDGVFTNAEWSSTQEHIKKNLSGTAESYALHAGSYLRRESANAQSEARIRELEGKDRGSDRINVGGILSDLDITGNMSRQRAYLWRYPDVAREWDIRTGTVKDSGARTAEEWATYHYNRYGKSEGRKYALGGVFTNSVVDQPTSFPMGLMGEAGAEAIMPLTRHGDGSLGVRAELPALPPLLGQSDVVEVLRDLKREVAELRRENARLQGEGNKHAAASVQVQQAGFTRQIDAQERANRSLDEMGANARLEASR